jgi:hypothetical protein
VKAFGAEIIEDHHYASEEAKELSAEEEIYLPVQLGDQQKNKSSDCPSYQGKHSTRRSCPISLKNTGKICGS